MPARGSLAAAAAATRCVYYYVYMYTICRLAIPADGFHGVSESYFSLPFLTHAPLPWEPREQSTLVLLTDQIAASSTALLTSRFGQMISITKHAVAMRRTIFNLMAKATL